MLRVRRNMCVYKYYFSLHNKLYDKDKTSKCKCGCKKRKSLSGI